MHLHQGFYSLLILAAAIVAFRTMLTRAEWPVRIIIAVQIFSSLIFLTNGRRFIDVAEWLYVITLAVLLFYSIKILKNYLSTVIVLPVFIVNLFRVNHWPFAGTLGWLCIISVIAYLTLGFRYKSKNMERGLFAISAADALVIVLMRIQ